MPHAGTFFPLASAITRKGPQDDHNICFRFAPRMVRIGKASIAKNIRRRKEPLHVTRSLFFHPTGNVIAVAVAQSDIVTSNLIESVKHSVETLAAMHKECVHRIQKEQGSILNVYDR